MRSYVELTKNLILKNIEIAGDDKPLLFRIEDVPDPRVYWEVATYFDHWASRRGRRFVAKLAWGKYNQFLGEAGFHALIEQMKAAGYIDEENRMTHWRNQAIENGQLTILMGTEVVEDKGGLRDFFAVTADRLEKELNGEYATWFERVVGRLADRERAAINNLIHNIFRVSTRDLFRLSNVVDELDEKGVFGVENVVIALFDRLYDDWGLPRVRTRVPSVADLATAARARSIVNELAAFRDRQDFRDINKRKLRNLLDNIEKCDVDVDVVLQTPGYTSVEEFKRDLRCYITGEELPRVRSRILQCDYSLIRTILALKSAKTRTSPTDTAPKVYGPPLKAFLNMIISTVAENRTVEAIEFSLVSIRLAGCSTKEEAYEQWHRVRLMSGGLLEFLNAEFSATCNLELRWRGDQDPFGATGVDVEEDVKRAAASKKLSTIEFAVTTGEGTTTYFLWEFDPKAPWLYTFFHVLNGFTDMYKDAPGKACVPLVYVRRISELVSSNNEEEFFSRLETTVADYSTNVIELLRRRLSTTEHGELLARVEILGERFTQFLGALLSCGFFASRTEQRTRELVEYYCDLIKWFGEITLTSAARDALIALVNAFLLVEWDPDPFKKGFPGAVVLPLHPAMLEKLRAQAEFIRDGGAEIIRDMRSGPGGDVRRAERRLRTFEQLSTIPFAVDTLWAKQGNHYLPPTHTFGYFSVYRESELRPARVSVDSILADDVAADEEIPASEVLRESPVSEVIFGKLDTYLRTFPSHVDGLHVVFINPPDLQPVVAGIHKLIESMQKRGFKARIRLTVLAPPNSLGSRTYLHYWLDNFFEDRNDVDIATYFKTVSFTSENLGWRIRRALDSPRPADVTFIQNVLGVTTVQFRKFPSGSPEEGKAGTTRFPMVFHPLPVFRTSSYRRTSISQSQFKASTAHARLVYYLSDPMNEYRDCGVINELQLPSNYVDLLKALHDHSRWVVCIDPGIDRRIVSSDEQRIISFATGVGPFGELNVTVSAKRESTVDLRQKLESRLRSLFSRWSAETLRSAADRCLKTAERLDGAHLLQALNPDDYQLHSFLAYVLTARYLNIDSDAFNDANTLIRTLAPLDSYDHWFRLDVDHYGESNRYETAQRPDFLLLEVKRENPGRALCIHATVIECKMGRYSLEHVEKGREQLSRGIRVLKALWNPARASIDARYWYSQLYRALVFSTVNMSEDDQLYDEFIKQLQGILHGEFSILWRGLLLTYWLDTPSDSVTTCDLKLEGCPGVLAEQHTFGQVSIQKMLVDSESEIGYVPIPALEGSDVEEAPASTGDLSPVEPPDQEQSAPMAALTLSAASEIPTSTDEGAGSADRLQAIRILIGEDVQTREPVYWEYGHPELPNRHILITGSSGSGKTYFIQALLLELSRHGVSSLIFDYTDGFTPQKLEPEFVECLRDKIVQLSVYQQPFPLNPFKRYPIEVAGELVLQKPVDVAERIKSSFTKVFRLGDQQANAVYNAIKQGMEKHGENMTLANLREELRSMGASLPAARTALARLEPLIDRHPFDHSSSQDWGMLERNPGSVVIIQLSGFARDVQVAITQLILWDAWYYQVQHGDKSRPFPVVLDEAQNLDHSQTSPTAVILTEGRKFGWSGWFATQFLKGQMEKDELARLQQASQKAFFRPPETELRDVALMIDPDRGDTLEWQSRLARLQKGECIVSGWIDRGGKLYKDRPRIVRVTPLSARGGAGR